MMPSLYLIEHDAVGYLLGESLAGRDVTFGTVEARLRRCAHDFGPQGAQGVHLLVGHLLGHDDDAAVAACRGRHGYADAGVAARGLEDGAAGLEDALLLGVQHHPVPDPVLDRAPGVQVFAFRDWKIYF